MKINENPPSTPLRVLHVIDNLGLGGAQNFLIDLTVSSYKLDGSVEHEIIGLHASTEHLTRFKDALRAYPCHVSSLSKSRTQVFSIIRSLARRLRRHDYDLLHLHLPVSSIVGGFLARVFRVSPVVSAVYAMRSQLGTISFWQFRFVARCVDMLVALSPDSRTEVMSVGVSRDQIRVIPLGVDFSLASPSMHHQARSDLCRELGISIHRPLILSVARLTRDRHSDVLCNALLQLAAEHPEVAILVVGDGGLSKWLEAEVQRRKLGGTILLAGSRSDRWHLYPACDVYVAISFGCKNSGIAHLEAMSCARPMVTLSMPWYELPCARTTCVNEGKYIATRDARSFVDAIMDLFDDTDGAHQLGMEARRSTIKQFSIEGVTPQYSALYHELASRAIV